MAKSPRGRKSRKPVRSKVLRKKAARAQAPRPATDLEPLMRSIDQLLGNLRRTKPSESVRAVTEILERCRGDLEAVTGTVVGGKRTGSPQTGLGGVDDFGAASSEWGTGGIADAGPAPSLSTHGSGGGGRD